MSPEDKLDAVLHVFKDADTALAHHAIYKAVKAKTHIEDNGKIDKLLERLEADGYVRKKLARFTERVERRDALYDYREPIVSYEDRQEFRFELTQQGEVFIEDGGYKRQRDLEEKAERREGIQYYVAVLGIALELFGLLFQFFEDEVNRSILVSIGVASMGAWIGILILTLRRRK